MEGQYKRIVEKINDLSFPINCAYYFMSCVNGFTNLRHGVETSPARALDVISSRLFKNTEPIETYKFHNSEQLFEYVSVYGGDVYEYYLYYNNQWIQPLTVAELCLYYYFKVWSSKNV